MAMAFRKSQSLDLLVLMRVYHVCVEVQAIVLETGPMIHWTWQNAGMFVTPCSYSIIKSASRYLDFQYNAVTS